MIGKGTGQPRLDAESHGRNSPATTVRKQEGRELQGQQEKRSKNHTSELKTEGRTGNRLGKQAPLSHPHFSEGWNSVCRGPVGWQTCHCSHSSPPASPTVPHQRGDSRGGEEGQGLSPPPPAQPSRVPASPPEVFPNPCSHGRHVGTRSSQAAVREAAFPRSPASALPTPPVPPPWCGCKGDLGPTAQAPPQSPVTSTCTAPCSLAALPLRFQPAADAGSEELRAGLLGVFYSLPTLSQMYPDETLPDTPPPLPTSALLPVALAPQSFPRTQAALEFIRHRGTTTAEPSKAGWFFSKCFGGCLQRI